VVILDQGSIELIIIHNAKYTEQMYEDIVNAQIQGNSGAYVVGFTAADNATGVIQNEARH